MNSAEADTIRPTAISVIPKSASADVRNPVGRIVLAQSRLSEVDPTEINVGANPTAVSSPLLGNGHRKTPFGSIYLLISLGLTCQDGCMDW